MVSKKIRKFISASLVLGAIMFIPTSNDVTFTKTAHANSIWGTIKDIGKIYKDGQKAEKEKKAKKQAKINLESLKYVEKGHEYFEAKDYNNAVAEYTKAIEIRPKDSLYYDYRGNAYYELQDYQKALKDYNDAITIEKPDGIMYYNRGLVYFALKDYDKAMQIFQ